MPLRTLVVSAGRLLPLAFVVCVLNLVGCGNSDEGKVEFSQKFDAPPGAKTVDPNTNPVPSRTERRRQEIEESRQEPIPKGKGQRRR